jgi:Uma2 family endonuclease
MSIATTAPVTLEEFLRLEAEAPEGVSLELIDGEIVENPMSVRSPKHSQALARISQHLLNWLETHPSLVGSINVGDVRCRLQRDPDRIVGIDAGVWLGSEFVEPPDDPPLYDAPPVVAIEVLSPSDTHESVTDKLFLYLSSGVAQVWMVDPDVKTVMIHRPDVDPQLFSSRQVLTAEPELIGLRIPVVQLFQSRSTSTAKH